MKRLCVVVALAGLVLARGGWAETGFGTAAFVVAIDAKAKTITLKHTDSKGQWKQSVRSSSRSPAGSTREVNAAVVG